MSSSAFSRRPPGTVVDSSTDTGATTRSRESTSGVTASLASVARDHSLSDQERLLALELEVVQLRTALASRAQIEQAKGILMLLAGCGEQRAFDLLVHISSNTHRKVREVAVEIARSTTGRHGLPPDIRSIIRDFWPEAPAR